MILGGGYTGMWTAWFLKERQPDLDVVLLEADICGGGPSGRNGGFLTAGGRHLADLAATYGDADAMELLMARGRSPAEIGAWCRPTTWTPGTTTPASSRSRRAPRRTAVGGHVRRGAAARRGRRVPGARRGGGSQALRVAAVPRRLPGARRGHGASGAPRARPAAGPARARGPHPRAHTRHAVPARPAGGRRNAARRRQGRSGRGRARRLGDVVASVPSDAHRPRLVHGRSRPRRPSGSRT